MPSATHEGIVLLFRSHPALAAELLERCLGVVVPGAANAALGSEAAPQHDPRTLSADAVVLLGGDPPDGATIVEVQLSPDEAKRYAWPFHIVSHRRTLRCPVRLLVVTVDETIAIWASQPIDTGHDGFVLRPHVIGPSSIPVITDPREAAVHPELAVLSARAHANHAAAVPIAVAALVAVEPLDAHVRSIYFDVILGKLGDAARTALEALMQQGHYEYQSEFARRYFAEGKAEGKAEGEAKGEAQGRAEGKADGVLVVLGARGVAVSDEARERVRACRDLALLDRWIVLAVTAVTVEELFDASA